MNQINVPEEKLNQISNVLIEKGYGKEMPMLSLPFLDWFNSYDFSNFNFLEIGSGFSTRYFAEKVKSVISFETNIIFYENLKTTQLPDNVEYNIISAMDLAFGKFYIPIVNNLIVLIDCDSSRYQVTKRVLDKCSPEIIILDNSEWFTDSANYIYEKGYTEIIFWGIRLEENEDKATSVFIKNNWNLPKRNYNFFAKGSFPIKHWTEGLSLEEFKSRIDSGLNRI